MVFWLVVLAVVAAAAVLAWWSSSRTRRVAGRPDSQAEVDRGWGTAQAVWNRDNGQSGGF